MPASSVSLSTINIAPMTAANASAVAPGRASAQGGCGGENSFSQWMQQAQSSADAHPGVDGEHLPDEGKSLPTERQSAGMQAAETTASGDAGAVSDDGQLVPQNQNKAVAIVDSEQGAEDVEAAEQLPDIEAEPVAGQDATADQTPVADSVSEAVEEDGNGDAVLVVQTADPEVGVDEGEQSAEGAESAEPVAVAEQMDAVAAGVLDPEESDSGAGSASAEQIAAPAETDAVETEQLAAVVDEPVLETEEESQTASVESRGPQRELPEQAARPDVREAALQNRGQLGPDVDSTGGAHGQRVSEIARGPAKGEIEQRAIKTAETDETADIDEEGLLPPVEAKKGIEDDSPGVELAVADESSSQQDQLLVATTDSSDDSQQVDAETKVEMIPVATVAAPANRADTADRVQSVREPQVGGATGQSAISAGSAVLAGQSAQASAGGDGQQSSGQQSGGQNANRAPDSQQLSAAVGAAVGNNASSGADADQSPVTGRHASVTGAESRTVADAAATTTTSNLQTLDTAKTESMSSAAMQRLQDPAWSRAMGQRAIMMAQYGPRTAEIQLDPPELGAMQIRIHLGAQDQVSVSFSSPHAAVRDAIEQQMPRLREMFAEQGLELSQSSVSDQSANGGGDGSSQARGRGGSGDYGDLDDGGESPATLQSVPVGLVDYYA